MWSPARFEYLGSSGCSALQLAHHATDPPTDDFGLGQTRPPSAPAAFRAAGRFATHVEQADLGILEGASAYRPRRGALDLTVCWTGEEADPRRPEIRPSEAFSPSSSSGRATGMMRDPWRRHIVVLIFDRSGRYILACTGRSTFHGAMEAEVIVERSS